MCVRGAGEQGLGAGCYKHLNRHKVREAPLGGGSNVKPAGAPPRGRGRGKTQGPQRADFTGFLPSN